MGGEGERSELALRVTTKPWLGYCDSRFGLPLSLTSSTLRAQLPFAASLKEATRASYFRGQARRSCDEAGPRARGKGYSRLRLPLFLISSTLRGQLPFATSLKGATRARAQARRSGDEAGPGRGAGATHDLDYPCSLPRQRSEGSYRSLRMTWTTPVPKLPRQVGRVMLTSNLWVV